MVKWIMVMLMIGTLHGHKMQGLATHLGCGWNGKHGASGIRYNCKDPTAAHKSIPFGTVVRVYNDDMMSDYYNYSVDVVIIDRGPQRTCGAIDMQPMAFKKITRNRGGEHVRLEIISDKYACVEYFCLKRNFGDIRITDDILDQMITGTFVPKKEIR